MDRFAALVIMLLPPARHHDHLIMSTCQLIIFLMQFSGLRAIASSGADLVNNWFPIKTLQPCFQSEYSSESIKSGSWCLKWKWAGAQIFSSLDSNPSEMINSSYWKPLRKPNIKVVVTHFTPAIYRLDHFAIFMPIYAEEDLFMVLHAVRKCWTVFWWKTWLIDWSFTWKQN